MQFTVPVRFTGTQDQPFPRMSRASQIKCNGIFFVRAILHLQWKKIRHYNRGLCRAITGHDQFGTWVADCWPMGTLLGLAGAFLIPWR